MAGTGDVFGQIQIVHTFDGQRHQFRIHGEGTGVEQGVLATDQLGQRLAVLGVDLLNADGGIQFLSALQGTFILIGQRDFCTFGCREYVRRYDGSDFLPNP